MRFWCSSYIVKYKRNFVSNTLKRQMWKRAFYIEYETELYRACVGTTWRPSLVLRHSCFEQAQARHRVLQSAWKCSLGCSGKVGKVPVLPPCPTLPAVQLTWNLSHSLALHASIFYIHKMNQVLSVIMTGFPLGKHCHKTKPACKRKVAPCAFWTQARELSNSFYYSVYPLHKNYFHLCGVEERR